MKLLNEIHWRIYMLIGYARVSTDAQHTENQIEQLILAGCEKNRIYKDTASGGCWERPQLHKALDHLREGDTLVVWKFDRLSRSLSDLIRIIDRVNKAEANFKSLTESIDTATPVGRAMMHILGTFAEFEREMIRERTKLGLQRAKAKGVKLGGHFILSKARQDDAIRAVLSGKTQAEVAREQDVSKATICRMMALARAKEEKKAGLL
jgi:DNA invertase Pin-like site-specific DNA recombinase